MDAIEQILNHAPRNGDDPLLTAEEVAEIIGVSAGTVRRWLRDGAINYEPIGPKRKRVRKSVAESLAPKRSTFHEDDQDSQDARSVQSIP